MAKRFNIVHRLGMLMGVLLHTVAIAGTLPGGYEQLAYVTIPRPSNSRNGIVVPSAILNWSMVKKVYVKYSTTDTVPANFMMLAGANQNTPLMVGTPYLSQKAAAAGGINVTYSGLTSVVPQFTPGDTYARDGSEHELTVSFSSSSTQLIFMGCCWNDATWNCTANWCAVKLYGEGDALLMDIVPCRNDQSEVGFYDLVNSCFLGRIGPVGDGEFIAGPVYSSEYLTLDGYPEKHGGPVPDYGRVQPEAGSHAVTLRAPLAETNESKGVIAYCTGWKMKPTVGEETTGTDLSYDVDFTQPGVTGSTFTWLFSYSNRVVVAAVGTGNGHVSYNGGAPVSSVTNWIASGEAVSVAATASAGTRFVRWMGEGFPSEFAKTQSFDFAADGPVVLKACFPGRSLPAGFRKLQYVTIPKVTTGKCQNPAVVSDLTWGMIRSGSLRFSTVDQDDSALMLFGAKNLAEPETYPELFFWLNYDGSPGNWTYTHHSAYGLSSFVFHRPEGETYARDGSRHTVGFSGTPYASFEKMNPVFGCVYKDHEFAHTSDWYGVKFYDADGDILCDAKPCERTSDGKAGFLNVVTGAFYYNTLGDKEYPPFIAGPRVKGLLVIVW